MIPERYKSRNNIGEENQEKRIVARSKRAWK